MLFILAGIILWVYFYNRKKYHNLKHQIPASVVKNYLDSIIQNSNALKSSLFRGGGLDVDPSSIPSVLPLDQMLAGGQVGVSLDGLEGDEALKAEIAKLQAQLSEKNSIIKELETKTTDLSGQVKQKQERIEELEALLAAQGSNTGDSDLAAKLAEVTAERDKLKEDLAQYEIIEDDFADLKRLRQENEQLKSALAASGAQVPVVEDDAEPEAAAAAAEPVAEPEVAEAAPEPVTEDPIAAAPVSESTEEEEKSPEDLLSEFEKMLG